jgi:cyanophycinase-like exopeptidase
MHAMKSLDLTLAVPAQRLVLIGGGEFSFGETRAIDEALVARMPAGNHRVAFLPTASGSTEYANQFGTYLRQIDPALEVVSVPIYRGRDNRRMKNLDAIANAGMVYVGGGVTNQLLAGLRGSPAEEALRDAASRGAVIAAIGAAAASFGAHARDMNGTASALQGFGWLEGTVIDSPFTPENDTMLRRLMSIPDARLGLGIPAGTALAIAADGTTELLGEGSIAVFRKPAA